MIIWELFSFEQNGGNFVQNDGKSKQNGSHFFRTSNGLVSETIALVWLIIPKPNPWKSELQNLKYSNVFGIQVPTVGSIFCGIDNVHVDFKNEKYFFLFQDYFQKLYFHALVRIKSKHYLDHTNYLSIGKTLFRCFFYVPTIIGRSC